MGKTHLEQNKSQSRLDKAARSVGQAIEGYLCHEPSVPETLYKSMTYSVRAGGKKLRPVLVILACEACGGQEINALPAAAAMEMVHTYSLIHDDLPAMDDDDMRRGQPSNHKAFGEGIAILAGDALLTCAFHTIARHMQQDDLVRKLVLELSRASGAAGMIGGQACDLLNQNSVGSLETVNYIHTHKTALMFRAATRMGAICANADEKQLDVLGDYGLKIGLAFQIVDDLLDITGTTEEMGKRTQKDKSAGKLTYPAVVGMAQAQQKADELIEQAVSALEDFSESAEPLRYLAGIVSRRKN